MAIQSASRNCNASSKSGADAIRWALCGLSGNVSAPSSQISFARSGLEKVTQRESYVSSLSPMKRLAVSISQGPGVCVFFMCVVVCLLFVWSKSDACEYAVCFGVE